MKHTFSAVFEKLDNWYIGYVEELPGANTQGKTLLEAKENLEEAIELILKANKQLLKKQLARRKVIRRKIHVAV